jgi:flagellar biosynthesis anti-sigma factor FlgM
MRINGSEGPQRTCGVAKSELRSVGEAEKNRASGEAVVLGERAAKLTDQLAADDAVREQRLTEIKKQLDEGTYTIDLDLLAEKLVDEEIARSGGQ